MLKQTSATIGKEVPSPKENTVLSLLPTKDYERLLPDLKYVDLPRGFILSESGDHVNFLYFPVTGIVSLIYALENGETSETALVGKEGIVGISIFMGGESMPTSTEVQTACKAYRLNRSVMKREFDLGGRLQELALLFTQSLINQTSQAAVCNQHHTVTERICRWLLMSLDRIDSKEVTITQESIGRLLGIRRESVTQTMGMLEKEGLVERARGKIKVINITKLRKRVCECYGVVKEEYDRLMPAP